MKSVMPLTIAVGEPVLERLLAPRELVDLLGGAAGQVGREDQHALGGIGAPVEHEILDVLAQHRIELVVDRELAGR